MTPSPRLRPQQADIAAYRGGKMAVSAVPGSGKTHTLSALACELIATPPPPLERRAVSDPPLEVGGVSEILVVTFTNSAVDNVRARIRRMLGERGLPDAGYRVFTLHGLANSIIKERPDLAGTTSDYRVDDELSGSKAMPEAARWFIQQERAYWLSFLPPDLTQQQRFQVEDQWTDQTIRLGYEVTKLAKNLRLSPVEVNRLIASEQGSRRATSCTSHLRTSTPASPFLKIGAAIYERYDAILKIGRSVDFDDLIWGAIRALQNDDAFRKRLGERYPFILEDEAQDSTPLQEEILGLLSRDHGNWVRVGDPNQAIMTTFTASDVASFARSSCAMMCVSKPLAVSGRSAQPIVDLANRLAGWSARRTPNPKCGAMP